MKKRCILCDSVREGGIKSNIWVRLKDVCGRMREVDQGEKCL